MKIKHASFLIALILSSSLTYAENKTYRHGDGSFLKYEPADYWGEYELVMNQTKWMGSFNTFTIDQLKHGGYFSHKTENATCDGTIDMNFSRDMEKVEVEWKYTSGFNCPFLNKSHKKVLNTKIPENNSKPTKDKVKILKVIAGGPGCPEGTFSSLVTSTLPEGPADFFEIIYDSFSVQKGPGTTPADARKHCTVAVDLDIPSGWQFSIMEVHYEGFADIPKNNTGLLSSEYSFPHSAGQPLVTKKVITGPFADTYRKEDSLGLFTGSWSPCGKKIPLNMKSTLWVKGPAADVAYMTVDQQTGLLTQKWAIAWRQCTP